MTLLSTLRCDVTKEKSINLSKNFKYGCMNVMSWIKGFAVGNAVTNYDTMDNAMVPYEWGRGLIGTE